METNRMIPHCYDFIEFSNRLNELFILFSLSGTHTPCIKGLYASSSLIFLLEQLIVVTEVSRFIQAQ